MGGVGRRVGRSWEELEGVGRTGEDLGGPGRSWERETIIRMCPENKNLFFNKRKKDRKLKQPLTKKVVTLRWKDLNDLLQSLEVITNSKKTVYIDENLYFWRRILRKNLHF